jgi:GT2 family glycosyltransferase
MRLGAFIITFNRSEILNQTLPLLLQQTRPPDTILVVDNGSSAQTKAIVDAFSTQNVIYHDMGDNLGPAGASAYALEWLVKAGYDWIYWGDEDDPPQFPDVLERLMKLAEKSESSVAAVGAVGAKFDWSKGESVRLPDEAIKGIIEVDSIGGNSQLIMRSAAIQQVGLPDIRLFFGSYEPEYCHRIRRAGYRLLVDGDLMWKHREKAGRLQLQLSRALVSRYSLDTIWRRYYRTRNYIFMMKYTFQRPDLARRETVKALIRAVFSWARGPRYGSAFTHLQIQGIIDGYRGRMGRTVGSKAKAETTLFVPKPG